MPISPLPALQCSPGPAIRSELARHVRAWRLRLDPDQVPGTRPGWSAGGRRRVSQERLAQLIGCSTHWFARLELGYARNYSEAFLAKVADALRLDDDETCLLFLLTGKQPPERDATVPNGLPAVVTGLAWPSYISDQWWDVAAYNDALRSWFPWVQRPRANIMRWVFTDPQARRRLYRWERDWAPRLLTQLRLRQLRRPTDRRLQTLTGEILDANPDARRMWEAPLSGLPREGSRRSIILADPCRPQPIEVIALQPPRAPDHRLVMMIPVHG